MVLAGVFMKIGPPITGLCFGGKLPDPSGTKFAGRQPDQDTTQWPATNLCDFLPVTVA